MSVDVSPVNYSDSDRPSETTLPQWFSKGPKFGHFKIFAIFAKIIVKNLILIRQYLSVLDRFGAYKWLFDQT